MLCLLAEVTFKKDLTVRKNFLLVIIPYFVASFKKSLFAFSVKELHFFKILLYEIKFSLDGQFKYLFFALDLFNFCKAHLVVICCPNFEENGPG